jgi:dimethylargininase
MLHIFSRAIVRPPGRNFADGLTMADLGAPDFETALVQHSAYCDALEQCGLTLVRLEPDDDFPDSTFVEDTAVLTNYVAVITRPGADSRVGETDAIMTELESWYDKLDQVQPPGTIDGGDVCLAGDRFLIGISDRTNPNGAAQLAGFFAAHGFTAEFVDITRFPGLLHLKSGISYLGDNRLLVTAPLKDADFLNGLEPIVVPEGEEYAANCVRINDHVLLPAGNPGVSSSLNGLGYQLIELEMSEFRKMDGGLSCLSLRF